MGIAKPLNKEVKRSEMNMKLKFSKFISEPNGAENITRVKKNVSASIIYYASLYSLATGAH